MNPQHAMDSKRRTFSLLDVIQHVHKVGSNCIAHILPVERKVIIVSKVPLSSETPTRFGRDAVKILARTRHNVFASMHDIAERNQTHGETLRAKQIDALLLARTNNGSVHRSVPLVLKRAGGALRLLSTMPAQSPWGLAKRTRQTGYSQFLNVNVFGVQRTLGAVLATFRSQGEGSVVNIDSVFAPVTRSFVGLYGTTKVAPESKADSYRYEWSPLWC